MSHLLNPPTLQPSNSSTPRLLALFLFLFACYLFTYTPRINSSDGLAMFSTAESLARRGALDIEQIRWMDLQQGSYGLDGLLYSRKGIGVPLGLLPLTWLGLVIPWFGPVSVSLLFNAIVTALTAVVLMAYLNLLGFSSRTALIVALTFGLATLAWPYAKSLFSDPLSGLLLLAAAYFLLKLLKVEKLGRQGDEEAEQPEFFGASRHRLFASLSPVVGYAFLAGLCLGWNVATRYAEALFLPIYGLLLLHYLFTRYHLQLNKTHLTRILRHTPFMLAVAAYCLPLLLIGMGLIALNLARYGNALNTGYLPQETFSGNWWDGIIGQLISPGRGLLLYSPVLFLSILGVVPFFHRFRAEALLALSVIVIHLLLYGKWFMWHGGYAWGPRFMVPTLPFWAIFLAPMVAWAFADKAMPAPGTKTHVILMRIILFTFLFFSLLPQIQSVAIDFGLFQDSLLTSGLPLFDRQTFFDFQYSPFVAAWPFITFNTLDLVWAWQGRLDRGLLLALIVNGGLATLNLGLWWPRKKMDSSNGRGKKAEDRKNKESNDRTDTKWKQHGANIVMGIACCSTLVTLLLLLRQAHQLSPETLTLAVSTLNTAVQADDAIITNIPELAIPFAEQYQGGAPVLGLNGSGAPPSAAIAHRLDNILTQHSHIWWLANWLPSEESAVEQTLRAKAIRTVDENINGQRLVLFANPGDLPAAPINAEFEAGIRLLAMAVAPTGQPGRALPVTLHWQASTPATEDFHVFIHVLDKTGQLIAQADGQPVQWTRPTSTWAVGETIVDPYGLWLPVETPPGVYQLAVGLYRPEDGQRLHLSDGADAVMVEISVK